MIMCIWTWLSNTEVRLKVHFKGKSWKGKERRRREAPRTKYGQKFQPARSTGLAKAKRPGN